MGLEVSLEDLLFLKQSLKIIFKKGINSRECRNWKHRPGVTEGMCF
jgi:hypothetical protein